MRLGRYEILVPLGRGSAGAVYQARSSSGEVAIKVLMRASPDAVARFGREQRLQGSLGEAEGFVPLLDTGLSPEGPFLVMPLLTGGTLRERLARGPMSVEDGLALTIKLARTLARAHARGIVHRDVKPENVIFTGEGEPLVADLGLAKHFDAAVGGASQSVNLSETGTFFGTAGYMPLEQMRDAKSAGPEADVFALGAILQECLTGMPAFPGESLVEVLARVEASKPAPLEGPFVPPWLAPIVGRALAREPEDRFADAGAFADALETRVLPGATRARSRFGPAVLLLAIAALLAVADFARGWSGRGEEGDPGEGARAVALSRAVAALLARIGVARESEGDHDGSIAAFSEALALDPAVAATWSDRGGARYNNGDYKGAIADCTRALELDPKLVEAWGNRGEAYWSSQDLAHAIADLARRAELSPRDAHARDVLGWARAMKNDNEGAVRDLTASLALDGSHAIVWYHRGWSRERLGDHAGAIDDQTKAIELDRRDTQAWIARAVAHSKLGEHEAAIEDFSEVIRLTPGDKLALYLRAVEHEEHGEAASAVSDYTRVLELTPDDEAALSGRAVARHAAGDLAGEAQDLEEYLRRHPEGAFAASIPAKLAAIRAAQPR